MVVPMPFTRAIFLYGEPIPIPRDGDVETWRLRVEQDLNRLAEEAEIDFEKLWKEHAG
jgi:lysophospholipid acyltransferase (LPLAT)-like uncharacterized protein